MARYQVIIAYDGTDFIGFQRQAGGAEKRTVQGVLEDALRNIGWQGRSLLSAGRTDTGVHASGQVIAFDLEWAHSPQALLAALNANLPPDVAVRAVEPAAADFHPRYDALARRYRYRLFCQPQRDPLRERYAWRVWPAVDIALMQQAAAELVGAHDFGAFGTPPRAAGATIRNVLHAGWDQAQLDPQDLVFEITANAFLYHMVRRLVGFQVRIGQKAEPLQALHTYLELGRLGSVTGMAPPQGLTLVEVIYAQRSIL